MNTEKKCKKRYGVQKKLMRFTVIQLLLIIMIISSAVAYIMRKYVKDYSLEKYQYVNMRLGISMDSAFKDTDNVTDNYSKNIYLQEILLEKEPDPIDKTNVNRALSYFQLNNVDAIVYIDNKDNVYPTNLSYSNIDLDSLYNSAVYDAIREDYSKTRWVWMEDTIFGSGKPSLFVARRIRHIDYNKEPGLLLIQMNDNFYNSLLEASHAPEDASYYVLDPEGEICYQRNPEAYDEENADREWLEKFWQQEEIVYNNYMELDNKVVYINENADTGFRIVTMVPNKIVFGSLYQLLYFIVLVFLLACGISAIVSSIFAKAFTKPIKQINKSMLAFDGSAEQEQLSISTGTELDSIGDTYNRMVENIQMLMQDIKIKEQALYESELNSLIYQINPHFLYNTLDNIYMIARLRKEEEIMKMIKSLSKFLRIGLNQGSMFVTVKQEIEHVCNYMNIQQIRNNHQFSYTTKIDARIEQVDIIKLILQPIVENALKHGTNHLSDGGRIIIHAVKRGGFLYLEVFNNGREIAPDMLERLNGLRYMTEAEAKSCFKQEEGGYGIYNVISRLKLVYGERFELRYLSKPDRGTICTIKIYVG